MNPFILLESKRVEIENTIASLKEGLVIEPHAEMMDSSIAYRERERAVVEINRQHARLAAVLISLRTLRDGTYGLCTVCEEAIEPKRLEALPEAQTCKMCQEREERK